MEITLKNLRRRAGLTQKQAAEKLRCTIPQVSSWETGRVEPHPNRMQDFVMAYKCTADEVVQAIWGGESRKKG